MQLCGLLRCFCRLGLEGLDLLVRVGHERVLCAELGLTRLHVAVDKFNVAFTMARLNLFRQSE